MGASQTRSPDKQLLRQALKDAFRQFQQESSRLSAIYASGLNAGGLDPHRAEEALLRVEQARLAYNEARDLLAASLMPPALRTAFFRVEPSLADGRGRVKDIAELFWELAGRPQGSAEADWYRAERILGQACYAR